MIDVPKILLPILVLLVARNVESFDPVDRKLHDFLVGTSLGELILDSERLRSKTPNVLKKFKAAVTAMVRHEDYLFISTEYTGFLRANGYIHRSYLPIGEDLKFNEDTCTIFNDGTGIHDMVLSMVVGLLVPRTERLRPVALLARGGRPMRGLLQGQELRKRGGLRRG